jgi:hypothetical protein
MGSFDWISTDKHCSKEGFLFVIRVGEAEQCLLLDYSIMSHVDGTLRFLKEKLAIPLKPFLH